MRRNLANLAQVQALCAQYETRLPAPPDDAIARLNISADKWYNFENQSEDTTSVMLYGAIGGWFGVTAQDFVKELRDIQTKNIHVHINSPGGGIFDGAAIYTALRQHPANVTAYVDGIAASAASFIAMAADEYVPAKNGQESSGGIIISHAGTMMIHDGHGFTFGNRDDHVTAAELLDKLSNTIAGIYARRAGGSSDEWRERMLADRGVGTWYTASEAVDVGLADRVDDDTEPDEEPPDTEEPEDKIRPLARVHTIEDFTAAIRAAGLTRKGAGSHA